MSTCEYLNAYPDLKKWDKPRHPNGFDWCEETGEHLDELVLVVAPPDYPRLAEGLEIGGVYQFSYAKAMMFYISQRPSDNYFFQWCEKLASLVTNGRGLQGGPYRILDWCTKLSESVEDKEKYPETEGRGPFWELLRYLLRGMTFGPVVCRKLVADFDEWEPSAWSLGDYRFYQYYLFLRKCFAFPGEHGLVYYPPLFFDENGMPYTESKLGADTADSGEVDYSTGGVHEVRVAHQHDDI